MGPHCRGRTRPARGMARPPFNGQLPLTPRAGHARPLPRGCHRLPGWAGVGGLVRRGGIHAARDVCGGGNSAGRIYAAPTNRSEKWRLRLVCRGGIHASRGTLRRRKHPGRDKSLPYALPANGCPPLRPGPGMPGPYKVPYFCLCPRAQTPQYLLFIISYLLFAPFVV